MPERIEIFGVHVDNVSMAETLDLIESFIPEKASRQVCTPNVEHIICSLKDDEFREIMNHAALTVPDGAGVVLVSRWNGTPLKEKVSGADLLPLFCERAAQKGYRVFLLGGREGVAERAARNLSAQHPGLEIAGTYSPPMCFEDDPNKDTAVVQRVREASPDVLFVALGAPRQEKWIRRHLNDLNVPVSIGVGAGIDFVAGEQKRAPRWMQSHDLEWLYRFLKEPRKIWRRVLVSIPLFVAMFLDLRTYSAQKRSIGLLVTSIKMLVVGMLILLSYCFSVWIRHTNEPLSFFPPWTGFFAPYQSLLPIVLLSYLFACLHFGFFRSKSSESPRDIFRSSFLASSLGTASVLICSFLFKEIYIHEITGFSRVSIGLTWLSTAILFFLARLGAWRVGQALARNGLLLDRVLVVGATPEAAQLIKSLGVSTQHRVKVVGIVSEMEVEPQAFEGIPILGATKSFKTILRSRKIDEVMIASNSSTPERLNEVLVECAERGIAVSLLSLLPAEAMRGAVIRKLGDVSMIALSPAVRPRNGKGSQYRSQSGF